VAKRGLGIALLLTAAVLGLWVLERDAPGRTVARDAPEVDRGARVHGSHRASEPTPKPRPRTDAAPEAEPDEPAPVATGKHAEGVVRNFRGEPVAGLWVNVSFPRQRLPILGGLVSVSSGNGGFTDEQGHFRITIPDELTEHAKVGFPGVDHVPIGDDLVFEFHGIAGRLLGVDGQPIGHGVILLRREDEDEILTHAQLAPEGHFAFPGVEDGLYRLSYKTHHAGSETTTIDGARSVRGWRTDIELRLRPGDTIEGIVLDASGEPRKGVWVRTTVGTTLTGSYTDYDGRFTVKGLDPSLEYRLTTWIRGYVPEIRDGIRAGTKDVRFTLDPGRRSTGRIVDARGDPVAKVKLRISPRIPLYPVTDKEGRFDLRGLPDGPIEVRAGTQVFRFRAGDRDLEFVLK
jgi:hypothetical protein